MTESPGDRRTFIVQSGKALAGASLFGGAFQMQRRQQQRPQEQRRQQQRRQEERPQQQRRQEERRGPARPITLFFSGDVMTGRGIDQVLPHSVDPHLHESYIKNARAYVDLAEKEHGEIPDEVTYDYVWGDALEVLDRLSPRLRIINLETSVTTSDDYWKGKPVLYRMHPRNTPSLTAAGIDCCVLANNHVMDWGRPGLLETLKALETAGIETAGAGRNLEEAQRPAVFDLSDRPDGGRVLVFGVGSVTGGIPTDWAAGRDRPGVHMVYESSPRDASNLQEVIGGFARPADLIVVSIHWGPNWDYDIHHDQQRFAHELIDAGVDIVHGHSSHHVKGIEVYRDKPILYGCGDFVTDYEGIGGHEEFRGDLGLMYFVSMRDDTYELEELAMTPTQMRRFQVRRAPSDAAAWLLDILNREGRGFGTGAVLEDDGSLALLFD